jgi:hypothetical protein
VTQLTSRRSAAHWHRLVILTLLVLAGACSGRDTGARVGMSRQSVLESSTAGLPKRQEVTANEKTDFYDWGWVRYDNQERVVEVYRKPLSDPAVSTAEVLPEGSRLEPIHRIAVAAPTIEIYKTKWFGRDERAAVDVASLRNRLSELMTTHLKRRFTSVTDLNVAAMDATTAAALQRAEHEFRAAIAGDPLNALSTGESANVIGWSLAQAAQQLEVDAIVLSVMTVTVSEAPAGSSMRSVGTAPLALSDERVDSGALCGHYRRRRRSSIRSFRSFRHRTRPRPSWCRCRQR